MSEWEEWIQKHKLGDTVEAEVVHVAERYALVNIDELTALLHISEMGLGFVSSASEKVSLGERIQVKIIRVNHADCKVTVSVRQVGGSRPSEAMGNLRDALVDLANAAEKAVMDVDEVGGIVRVDDVALSFARVVVAREDTRC